MLFNANTRKRFYTTGIGYGASVEDGDQGTWQPVIDNIANAKVNTVRIYRIRPPTKLDKFETTTSYDKFMKYLASKGLYAMIPLTPASEAPWKGCDFAREGLPPLYTPGPPNGPGTCYPSCLLTFAQIVINTFAKYTNTLSFVIGNEVLNKGLNFRSAPCLKRFTADVKIYMQGCAKSGDGVIGMRVVPLMYAAADTPLAELGPEYDGNKGDGNAPTRADELKGRYLNCGDPAGRVDIIGLNIYRWCPSNWEPAKDRCLSSRSKCGYKALHDQFKGSPYPVILSEFGCHQASTTRMGRDFSQVPLLFSSDYAAVFSGALAYAYDASGGKEFALFEDGRKVCYGSSGCDYDNWKNAFDTLDIKGVNTSVGPSVCELLPKDYDPSKTHECPDVSISTPDGDVSINGDLTDGNTINTRQGADGYVNVECELYQLTEAEKKITECSTYDAISDPPPGGIVGVIIIGTLYLFLFCATMMVLYKLCKHKQCKGLFQLQTHQYRDVEYRERTPPVPLMAIGPS